MPRYRFHIYNSIQTIDHEGKHFVNANAARDHAISGARDLMSSDLMRTGEINLSHWIEVEDDNDEITIVPFSEAVTVRSNAD